MLAGGLGIFQRAVVGRVNVRLAEKTPAHSANADHPGGLVVDLKGRPQLDFDAFAAEFFHRDLIDHHGVGQSQIIDAACRHVHWPAGERACVEADDLHILKRTIAEARLLDADVEWHSPCHALHTAHAIDFDLPHRDDLVGLLDFGIHHPHRGADVSHRCGRPHHQPAEDR